MAVSRLLLLLLLVLSTACDNYIKPNDFLCDMETRQIMNQAESLLARMGSCKFTRLPSLIRLPTTQIHMETWMNTQFQDRLAEILQSLSNLVQDVIAAKRLMQSACGFSLLERLEHNARNYQAILTHPSVTVVVEELCPRKATSSPLIQKDFSSKTDDFSKVLLYFDKLLSGRLERLIMELNVSCPLPAS